MQIENGDYLVVADENHRKILIEVTDSAKKSALLPSGAHYEYGPCHVLLNVGMFPTPGRYLGLHVEPQLDVVAHEFWGDQLFFRRFKKAEWQTLESALNNVEQILTTHKLTEWLPVSLEFRSPTGKSSGSFKVGKTASRPVLVFSPTDLGEVVLLEFLLLRECAIGVLHSSVIAVPKLWSAWQKLFLARSTKHAYSSQKLKTVLAHLAKHENVKTAIKEFGFAGDDASAKLLKQSVKFLASTYKLVPADVDALVVGNYSLLEEIWPSSLELSEATTVPIVTPDASKSTTAFFAESFALHLTGQSAMLPADVRKAVTRTLAIIGK